MRAPAFVAAAAAALVAACGPTNPGPSGELASVLNFGAYPRGVKIDEWYMANGGPVPMPGTNGWREYRTDDPPATIQAHYEQLARTHGWSITPVSGSPGLGYGGNTHVISMDFQGRVLNVFVSSQPGLPGIRGPVAPDYRPEPSPSPSPGASPTPTPTPTGPWYVRTEGQVRWR